MLGDDFHHLQVLNGNTLVAHLAGHAHSLEHLCRIGAGADSTGSTKTVVLAVGALTYATKTMTLHHALITLTFRGTYDIDKIRLAEEVNRDGVTHLVVTLETFELGQVALRCYSGFLEVTDLGLRQMLFLLSAKTELKGIIAVGLNSLDLSNHAGANFALKTDVIPIFFPINPGISTFTVGICTLLPQYRQPAPEFPTGNSGYRSYGN